MAAALFRETSRHNTALERVLLVACRTKTSQPRGRVWSHRQPPVFTITPCLPALRNRCMIFAWSMPGLIPLPSTIRGPMPFNMSKCQSSRSLHKRHYFRTRATLMLIVAQEIKVVRSRSRSIHQTCLRFDDSSQQSRSSSRKRPLSSRHEWSHLFTWRCSHWNFDLPASRYPRRFRSVSPLSSAYHQ